MSNTGTWMQRVAQDWLVLQLTGNSGTALGITTGLQFLPVLLLSPYAGVIADRFPKRRLLQVTQLAMAGRLAAARRCSRSPGVAQVWHVYVLAFVFGIGSAFDAPARQSFVVRDRRARRPHQRRRPQLRVVQPRPDRRARARRPADRRARAAVPATGWVILHQRRVATPPSSRQLQRMDAGGCCTPPEPAARTPGHAPRRASATCAASPRC